MAGAKGTLGTRGKWGGGGQQVVERVGGARGYKIQKKRKEKMRYKNTTWPVDQSIRSQ